MAGSAGTRSPSPVTLVSGTCHQGCEEQGTADSGRSEGRNTGGGGGRGPGAQMHAQGGGWGHTGSPRTCGGLGEGRACRSSTCPLPRHGLAAGDRPPPPPLVRPPRVRPQGAGPGTRPACRHPDRFPQRRRSSSGPFCDERLAIWCSKILNQPWASSRNQNPKTRMK